MVIFNSYFDITRGYPYIHPVPVDPPHGYKAGPRRFALRNFPPRLRPWGHMPGAWMTCLFSREPRGGTPKWMVYNETDMLLK